MAVLTDEELLSKTSGRKALSDEELLGAPAPSSAPVRSGQDVGEQRVDLLPNVPMPRTRPSEAPGGGTNVPDVEAGWDFKQKPGTWEGLGQSVQRGYQGAMAGANAASVGMNQRAINLLDKIQREKAAGKTNFTIDEDPYGFAEMTDEQIAEARGKGVTEQKESAVGMVERRAKQDAIPANEAAARVAGAETWQQVWEGLKANPVEAIAHITAESAIPSAIGGVGALGGAALGGMPGAVLGAGVGSYATNFASEIIDGLREAKVDLKNPDAIRAAFGDSALMDKIYNKAHAKSAAVGAFDALSIPVGGAKLLPKSFRPTGIKGRLAEAPISLPIQGGLGAAGEAAGSIVVGEKPKPGAMAAEFVGEVGAGPVDIVAGSWASDKKEAPAAVVSPGQVAAGVAGTEGIVAPTASPDAPQPPPGGTTPPPSAGPEDVKAEDGVNTVTQATLGMATQNVQNEPPIAADPTSRIPVRAPVGQIQDYRFQTEDVPIAWLKNLPGNDLRHSPEAMLALQNDIAENGINSPLIVTVGKNTGTAKIGEGNHRLAALEAMGYTHAPVRVIVGSQYGSEKGPAANVQQDLIPVADTYFKSDAKPSEVFRSLAEAKQPALIPAVEQQGVFGSAPVPNTYSRLFNQVRESGPTRATAQRWMAWVARGNFTKEEVNDLKLLNFLRSAGPREKITKSDILAHLDQNAISIQEIERTPPTQEAMQAATNSIYDEMYNLALADPTAIAPGQNPVDYRAGLIHPYEFFNSNHPGIQKLQEKFTELHSERSWTQYEKYTTPGKREGYVELTLHLPARDNDQKSGAYRAGVDAYGSHYGVANELVSLRITMRRTKDGQPLAFLEEMQSDTHQVGKKYGYMPPVDAELMRSIEFRMQHTDGARQGSYSREELEEFSADAMLSPEEINAYVAANARFLGDKVVDLPLKEGWVELGFNRFLMWAAERGIRHVAWSDAAEQMRRYSSDDRVADMKRQKGMEAFYYRKLESLGKKWKGRVGAVMGYTEVPGIKLAIRQDPSGRWAVFDANKNLPEGVPAGAIIRMPTMEEAQEYADRNQPAPVRFRSLTIPQTGIDYLNAGMPTHAQAVPEAVSSVTLNGQPVPKTTKVAKSDAEILVTALDDLAKQLNLGLPVNIEVQPNDLTHPAVYMTGAKAGQVYTKTNITATGLMFGWTGKSWEIRISLAKSRSIESMWITMTHELGHIIEKTTYANAPLAVRQAVDAAYDAYLQGAGKNTTWGELWRKKQNPIDLASGAIYDPNDTRLLSGFTPKDYEYHTSKAEWFADQVSKWATSKQKPLSTVEKFFSGLGKKLMKMFSLAAKEFGVESTGVPELMDWLDTQSQGKAEFFSEVMAETANEGTVENGKHMGPEETPPPAQIESQPGMDGANGLFNGNPPTEVKEAKAYADKFNWLYKMMMGVHQVAQRNPHLQALQEYVETLGVASQTKQAVMIHAQEILKKWNSIGGKQGDIVGRMLDEVQNMDYLTAAEKTAGVARLPTTQELQAMAQRLGVTKDGFDVFMDVTKSFQDFLKRVEAIQRAEANKITDQTLNGLAHAKIDAQMKALRSKPYFPAMRFGNYTLTIRNAAGKVVHFETFERKRDRDRALPLAQKHFGVPDSGVKAGFMDKQARPLLGVPTQLLDMLNEKLTLTSIQREALEQLKFELSPAQSFRHRFQHKRRIAGYSQDFRRAYASYFFHGANHIVKAMHADRLLQLADLTKVEGNTKVDITKLEQIVKYMKDHREEWLNPSSDWAWARGIAFTLSLAYSPAAAGANLTQTLLTSYPFLASRFGDARAIAALMNSGRKFQTFYTKGKLENATAFDQQALYKAIEIGKIKASQAPELAGYADGDILGIGFGGSLLQRNWVKFNELGALMFEMAEQVNRRLIFSATLDLALANPNAKYVKDAVVKNKLMYDEARATMTEEQAAAFVAAIDATDTTQFQYSREYAPRAFRGHARTVLVFKTFVQSYLMFLANYPAAAVRSILILGMLGGFMALPGADELKDILKALAYRFFGKDLDLEKEGRKLIIEMLGDDENGRQWAELIMHGAARKGYGIPLMMDLIGGTVGIDLPMPTFDRSSSISMGTILPVDFSVLGEQTQSTDALIAKQAQKVSGAFFGAGFNIYRALMNYKVDPDDTKRWERAMPRALGDLAEAYRVGTQGAETRADGSKSVTYDVRDPQQVAEVIGIGMGYTPYRKTLQREIDNAQYDAVKTWEIRQQSIIRQFGNAILGKDEAEIAKVKAALTKFNDSLPTEAKGFAVTGDMIQKSVETKATSRAYREEGLSTRERDIPVMQNAAKLYPESQRKLRKVKSGLTP